MAKIDTSKIEGFDAMSADDKLNALLGYEFEAPAAPAPADGNADKLKKALEKANAEAADYKRQLREKQSEAERAAAEAAEQDRAIREELATLKREQSISKMEAQYLAAGYSAEMAAQSAKAIADGDMQTVLNNQMAYIEATKKSIEAAALGKQPPLSVGTPPAPASKEDAIVAEAMKYAGLS